MRFWTVVTLSALVLAGCSKSASLGPSEEAAQTAAPAPPAPGSKPNGQAQQVSQAVTVALLAYTYAYDLVAPAKAVPDLLNRDQKACADAGPQTCQVVGSTLTQGNDETVTGRLQIQARPDWLSTFRDRLASETKAAGGRIANSRVESEDLTRKIVDTEAAVRAKTALRDRLQQVLATRPGKLSDLFEMEKALAQVQGELDATQSELAVMRTRVATSLLTINYSATPHVPALTDALRSSTTALVATLSLMLTAIAALAPWAAAAGLGLLVYRRFVAKKPKPSATA